MSPMVTNLGVITFVRWIPPTIPLIIVYGVRNLIDLTGKFSYLSVYHLCLAPNVVCLSQFLGDEKCFSR